MAWHADARPALLWTTQWYARGILPWPPTPSPASTPAPFLLSTLHLPLTQRESSSLGATLFQFNPQVHLSTTSFVRLTLLNLITTAAASMPQSWLKLCKVANPRPAHPPSPLSFQGNHNRSSCSQLLPLPLPPDSCWCFPTWPPRGMVCIPLSWKPRVISYLFGGRHLLIFCTIPQIFYSCTLF